MTLPNSVDTQIKKAYKVIGDAGNVGGGRIIGVYYDKEEAKKMAKGRGSLDCGGDGLVYDCEVVELSDGVYLVEGPIIIGETIHRDFYPETVEAVCVDYMHEDDKYFYIKSKGEEAKEVILNEEKYNEIRSLVLKKANVGAMQKLRQECSRLSLNDAKEMVNNKSNWER